MEKKLRAVFRTIEYDMTMDDEEIFGRVVMTLKKLDRYRSDLLYTGVKRVDWEILRRYGAEREDRWETFAYREAEAMRGEGGDPTITDFTIQEDRRQAIMVYNPDYFDDEEQEVYFYRLLARKPRAMREALVAGFRLVDTQSLRGFRSPITSFVVQPEEDDWTSSEW